MEIQQDSEGASPKDDTELGRLMHDFNCKNPEEMYSEVLANRVHELKTIQEGVNDMCQEMEQLFREGVAEGKAEGKAAGKAESKLEFALTMSSFGFSTDMISQILKVSVSEVQDWISGNRTPDK